ncbi:MAG: hypothetical protein ACK4N5_18100, partial [Myxococcales bacterium]
EGIPFDAAIGMEPGRVRVTVRLDHWLRRIDFARASPPDAEGLSHFPAGSQPANAFTRGAEDTGAWIFTWPN